MNDKKKMHMALGLMFLTVFIDLVGFGIIIPVMPLYAKQFGADGVTIGLLLMSYSLMQFFFAPFWGRLSDKVGRKPILMVSLCASAVGYLIWGFAGSLSLLFLSRIVAGIGNANLAVAQAYVSDVTTPEYRAQGMGMIGAAFGLGFVLGPAIGGLSSHFGVHPNILGFVASGFSLLALVFMTFVLPEPENRKKAAHDPFALGGSFYLKTVCDPKLSLPLFVLFISTFAFSNMEATLVLLTDRYFHYTMAQNSGLFTFIGVVMVLVQGGLIRRLAKKYPESKLISVGTLLIALGLLLTPATYSLLVLYGACALLATGSGINNPSNNSLISKLANPEQVGAVMGVGQSLSTLGRILGPVVGGLLWDRVGPNAPYWVGAGCMTIAFLLSFRLPVMPVAAQKAAASGSEADLATSEL